ncbi:DUF1963 domain-containing protein [Flavilitoribacter nigricans]|uniref:DUF1963 domain-containing protein n=1 Tax=Flavilitoribacter nigricans (strain ATCC 23147 / DSM 23189 / NBRC 102662 / NCIMB 1420 / SS-2) TaxID=1122177 RepID=A0A2D0N419_FLAN2|nr:DUF1963 domain-containing protein [Flavilitoribacter nigricans]PHN03187.1 hypothetical protein CRP01_27725 [Flavilitoribacter nigricans DSM 23189 = NBRC 102662]
MGLFDFFRKKTPKLTETERQELLTRTKTACETLARPAALAQLGGFRPTGDPLTSRFSGDFVMLESESWPVYEEQPLTSILQINLSELPFIPPALEGYQLITIFIDTQEPPHATPMGDGWVIRLYSSTAGLLPRANPVRKSRLKSFEIQWQYSPTECPDWEDADARIDLSELQLLDDAGEALLETFTNHELTKIGGWPSLIQHQLEMDADDFVIQIGSEPKANCNWIDGGNIYLGLVDGQWQIECQFH